MSLVVKNCEIPGDNVINLVDKNYQISTNTVVTEKFEPPSPHPQKISSALITKEKPSVVLPNGDLTKKNRNEKISGVINNNSVRKQFIYF